jgi:hypothetical protein
MEFFIGLLKQFIFHYVFQYPGAFIRWTLYRKHKSFKEILSDPIDWNVSVTVLFIGITVLVYKLLYTP